MTVNNKYPLEFKNVNTDGRFKSLYRTKYVFNFEPCEGFKESVNTGNTQKFVIDFDLDKISVLHKLDLDESKELVDSVLNSVTLLTTWFVKE